MTRASNLSPDDIARLLLAQVEDSHAPLTADEAEAIAEAEAEIERCERVLPEAMEAFWRTHGL